MTNTLCELIIIDKVISCKKSSHIIFHPDNYVASVLVWRTGPTGIGELVIA